MTGLYFRYKNPNTNKWENWLFEDLPEDVQRKYLEGRSIEWLENMIIILAKELNEITEASK